jgi:hypothetical protein
MYSHFGMVGLNDLFWQMPVLPPPYVKRLDLQDPYSSALLLCIHVRQHVFLQVLDQL